MTRLLVVIVISLLSCLTIVGCSNKNQLPRGKWYADNGSQVLTITKTEMKFEPDPRLLKRWNASPPAPEDLGFLMTPGYIDILHKFTATTRASYVRKQEKGTFDACYSNPLTQNTETERCTFNIVGDTLVFGGTKPEVSWIEATSLFSSLAGVRRAWHRKRQPFSTEIEECLKALEKAYQDRHPNNTNQTSSLKDQADVSASSLTTPPPEPVENVSVGKEEIDSASDNTRLDIVGTWYSDDLTKMVVESTKVVFASLDNKSSTNAACELDEMNQTLKVFQSNDEWILCSYVIDPTRRTLTLTVVENRTRDPNANDDSVFYADPWAVPAQSTKK